MKIEFDRTNSNFLFLGGIHRHTQSGPLSDRKADAREWQTFAGREAFDDEPEADR